jgi:predicted metal-dependent hydrolase
MSNYKGLNDTIKLGDFAVVLDLATRKKYAGTCDKVHGSKKRLEIVDKYGFADYLDIEIGNDSALLANLGQEPLPGTAYGCQIRKLHSRTEHSFWGSISIMRVMAEDERNVLKEALTDGYNCLARIGFKNAIVLDNLMITDAKGRYAGYYKQDKQGNHICLQPKQFEPKECSYIVNHELAHSIWYQLMSESARAEWVQLYTEYIDTYKTPEEQMAEVIDIVSAQSRHLDEYYELLEELEGGIEIFDGLVFALMDIHLLDRQDLDLYLWSLSSKKRKRVLERSVSNISRIAGEVSSSFPVSEYASKNTREFFAEAYSHYISFPHNIPDDVEELLKRTIPKIGKLKGSL